MRWTKTQNWNHELLEYLQWFKLDTLLLLIIVSSNKIENYIEPTKHVYNGIQSIHMDAVVAHYQKGNCKGDGHEADQQYRHHYEIPEKPENF